MSCESTSKHPDRTNEETSHVSRNIRLGTNCTISCPSNSRGDEGPSSSFEVRHGFSQSAVEEFFATYCIPEEQKNPFLMFLAHIQPIIFPSTEPQNLPQVSVNSGVSFNGLLPSTSSAELYQLLTSNRENNTRNPLPHSENGDVDIPVNPKKGKRIRSGATIKHNDPKLYPNILCSICKEWVCSRNRQLHISAHLKYHPYKCNICPYSNRSDILVRTHIKNDHGAEGNVVHETNKEIEKEIKRLSDESLQMTRDALTGKIFEKEQNCYGESVIPIRERIANEGRKRRTKVLSNLENASHN